MPRRPRMYLPGVPAHVVQRGNNRQVTFFCEDDYRFYLHCISDAAKRYGVAIHAYVLMTNHVHLLMTPEREDSISRMLQVASSLYVLYINKTYNRSGTLWEGRHKASLVQDGDYLFKCYRYIELNPVTAGMVQRPDEYYWSSYHSNGAGVPNARITPHGLYEELGRTRDERCQAYRELFRYQLSGHDLHEIRTAMHYGQPLGDNRFRRQIEEALGRSIGQDRRGRPRRELVDDEVWEGAD